MKAVEERFVKFLSLLAILVHIRLCNPIMHSTKTCELLFLSSQPEEHTQNSITG